MTDGREDPTPVPTRTQCETAARRLWDYLDGELDPARAREVDAHLAMCRRCSPHYAFARALADAIAATGASATPTPALRARVLDALRAEGYQGGTG